MSDCPSPTLTAQSESGQLMRPWGDLVVPTGWRLWGRSMDFASFCRISLKGGLEKPPTDALRPIISDNACILCLTADVGTELADAYSPDTVIASSPGKEVHDPWAFYLHTALLRQDFSHCGKFPTAASRRSLGRVSVPVWLIILSDQLLIISLPFPDVVPLPREGYYALLTLPPLETPFPVRLACVKHAASFLDIKRTSPDGNFNVADLPSFAISFATTPAALANCPPFPSVISMLCMVVPKGISVEVDSSF
ncbi:hypothetical protein C5167_043812 [Papaver somniferum]|uniref:Uncharacterized protein n=1 Tax=Papaver somniferum TaxID=3469 RepID=A0A4Y7L9Q9_PAPSO|nr:hypothetical protein C5167_043812 [Papaver somniferum]